jgi:3-mercaptopyruvate sulfurtransferase SseA
MPYAHPEDLVSTEWLAEHIDRFDVRVVDGSFTLPGVTPTAQEAYAKQHIPSAVFFDIDAISDHADPLPHMLPSNAAFAETVGRLGLGDNHRIIVYDMAGLSSAPRVWWMLKNYGHRNVAILDGGLPKWLAEGRPVTALVPRPRPASFSAKLDPALVRDRAQGAGDRCAQRGALCRYGARAPRQSAQRPYSGERQPAFRPAFRSEDAHCSSGGGDRAALRKRRCQPRQADCDELRLGRHRLRPRLRAAPHRLARGGNL